MNLTEDFLQSTPRIVLEWRTEIIHRAAALDEGVQYTHTPGAGESIHASHRGRSMPPLDIEALECVTAEVQGILRMVDRLTRSGVALDLPTGPEREALLWRVHCGAVPRELWRPAMTPPQVVVVSGVPLVDHDMEQFHALSVAVAALVPHVDAIGVPDRWADWCSARAEADRRFPDLGALWTVEQAARIVGVDEDTVREWGREDPAMVRFTRDDERLKLYRSDAVRARVARPRPAPAHTARGGSGRFVKASA